MRTFLAAFFGTLAAIAVVVAGPLLVLGSRSAPTPSVPDRATLRQPVGGVIPDYPASRFEGPGFSLRGTTQADILDNLEKAAVDDRIKRVFLDMTAFGSGLAKAEEIRDAVHSVRERGKPVIAWTRFMDLKTYSVAAACDSIVMIPGGPFVLTGLSMTRTYYRGALDKLGVAVDIDRIESWKSAAEAYMRTDMSPEAREMSLRLLDNQMTALREALGEERRLDATQLDDLMNRTVFLAEEAHAHGLIDGVAHREDLLRRYRGPGNASRIVDAAHYRRVDRRSLGLKGAATVAVVHGQGVILPGKNRPNPVLGNVLGSGSLVRELRRVAEDDDVDAVVLRLDTVGGDTWASDEIGREVERTALLKPVVVSMGDVCASGGYSAAYRATAIVALPSTITGSIGSFTGKANVRGFYGKLGITFDGVESGEHARILSSVDSWSEEQARLIRDNHWKSYRRWISDIAEKRKLDVADVDSVARGRVWTGREALELGLVDRLGGLDTAVREAADRAGVTGAVSVVHYPRRRRLLDALRSGELDEVLRDLAGHAAQEAAGEISIAIETGRWSVLEVPVP